MALKDQLEAAGYDTSGLDETQLIQKLDSAGYDTTSIAPKEKKLLPDWATAKKQAIDTVKTATMLPTQGLTKLGNAVQGGLDTAADAVNEKLGAAGHPYLGATAGTIISKAPAIVTAAQGIAEAPAAAEALTGAAKGIGNKIGNFVDVLKAPGQAEAQTMADQTMQRFIPNQAQNKLRQLATSMMKEPVENLQIAKSAMAEIPSQQADKASQLEQMRLSAGKQIGQAETELAPKFKSTPEFENFIADRQKVATFAQKLGKLGDMSPEDIQAKYSDADLMNIRKISQEAAKKGTLSDIGNTDLNTINQQASKALEVSSQKLGMARSTYKGILDKIDGLPAETKARTAAYKQYIIGEQGKLNAIKSQIKDLNVAAKEADAQELSDIQAKTRALVQKGLQHDKTIKYLKNGAIGAAIGVTGVQAAKHLL